MQLVYSAPVEKAAGRGEVHVPAPRLYVRADRQTAAVEVPLADLTWRVRLPEGYEIARTAGTLTPDNLPQPQSAVANVAAAAYLLAGGVNPFYNNLGCSAPAWKIASKDTMKPTIGVGESYSRYPGSTTGPPLTAPDRFQTDNRTPADLKIEATLNSPTELEFVDTPLTGVAAYLKGRHQIEIQLDKKSLEEASIAVDSPVKRSLRGVSLRSALKLILGDLGLTYLIQDGALLITTKEAAEQRLATVIYNVGDLVAARNDQGELVDDYDSLIDLINSTISPTCWDSVGGTGSITKYPIGNARMLVVTQTQEVHSEIAQLLMNLQKLANSAESRRKGLAQGTNGIQLQRSAQERRGDEDRGRLGRANAGGVGRCAAY